MPGVVKDGQCYKLQNAYPGSDRTTDLALRMQYDNRSAMPVKFHKVAPGVYLMQNKYSGAQDAGAENNWITFNEGDKWLYASCTDRDHAMPVRLKRVPNMDPSVNTFKMANMWPGEEGKWISFTTDGSWLRAVYSERDAMPLEFHGDFTATNWAAADLARVEHDFLSTVTVVPIDSSEACSLDSLESDDEPPLEGSELGTALYRLGLDPERWERQFQDQLGVTEPADLPFLTSEDLESVGIRGAKAKRFLANVEK